MLTEFLFTGVRYTIFANTEFCLKKYLPSFNKKGLASVSNSKDSKDVDIFKSIYNIVTLWINAWI